MRYDISVPDTPEFLDPWVPILWRFEISAFAIARFREVAASRSRRADATGRRISRFRDSWHAAPRDVDAPEFRDLLITAPAHLDFRAFAFGSPRYWGFRYLRASASRDSRFLLFPCFRDAEIHMFRYFEMFGFYDYEALGFRYCEI